MLHDSQATRFRDAGSLTNPDNNHLSNKALCFRPTGIVDVGANRGAWSRMARRLFPAANLVLVDGNNNTHHWTSLLRQPQPTARGAVAILDREERAAYWYTHDGTDADTGASLLKEQTAAFAGVTAGTERRTQTLDGLLARLHGGRPPPRGVCGLLKLDVQGAELSVLQGAIRCLAQAEAVLLEIGVAGSYNLGAASFAEHVAFLDAQGFSLFDVGEQHRMGPASLGRALAALTLTLTLTLALTLTLTPTRPQPYPNPNLPLTPSSTDGVLFQLDLLFVRTGDRFNRAAQAALSIQHTKHQHAIQRSTPYNRYVYNAMHFTAIHREGGLYNLNNPPSGAGCDQPLREWAEGRGGGRRGRTGASALKSAKATFEPSVDRSSFVSLPNPEGGCPGVGGEGRVAPLPTRYPRVHALQKLKILKVRASPPTPLYTLYTARQKPYPGPMGFVQGGLR